MWTNPNGKTQIENAIAQLRADIQELEAHLPNWISENKAGTNRYRPLAKRIILAAERLQELVKENTYMP
jgi:regulator of replication initiation timing